MSVGKDVENSEPSYIAVEVQNVQRKCKTLQLRKKTMWQSVARVKHGILIRPSSSTFGSACMYPKELNAGSRRDICTSMFTAALFPTAEMEKQPKCPLTDEWISKMWQRYAVTFNS